jgi:hypothetical protein
MYIESKFYLGFNSQSRLWLIFICVVSSLNSLILACNDDSGSSTSGIQSMWVQMGPSGVVFARAITENSICPNIEFDNSSQPMQVREQPSEHDFPVLVCETIIPPETTSASIEGRRLELPELDPKRIVIIGDTGCRIKGDDAQACNDLEAWPFEKVAESAAVWGPELVIHVGDYLYRESQCPDGNIGCEGSPFGDNWETWDADFFTPASALLASAPWVFTRGNHEDCSRAGNGWFRFLDPNPPFPECEEFTPPYSIDIGSVQLLMLDSSSAHDNDAPQNLVDVYSAQIDALSEVAGDNAWLVAHHPVWGIGEFNGDLFRSNVTLQESTGNSLKPGINLVLSGHIHLFEMLSFEGDRSPQFIVGFSGTELDQPISVPLAGEEIAGAIVNEGVSFDDFGFVSMEQFGGGWNVSIRNVDGEEIISCVIIDNFAQCSQVL